MEFKCMAYGHTGNMHLAILSSKAPFAPWELKTKEVDGCVGKENPMLCERNFKYQRHLCI